nr:hypothetical protein [Paenibacillus sp. 481]
MRLYPIQDGASRGGCSSGSRGFVELDRGRLLHGATEAVKAGISGRLCRSGGKLPTPEGTAYGDEAPAV